MDAISASPVTNISQRRAAPRAFQFPSCGLLKKIGALGKVNIGSPATKVVSLIIIGLGAASLATGVGIPAGVFLICAGVFLLGCSTEINIRDAATSSMRNYAAHDELNMVTFNAGNAIGDFDLACRYNEIETTKELYRTSQVKTAKLFEQLAGRNQLDVLTIQEVQGADVLINALRKKGYVVVKSSARNVDCAILLNTKRFQIQKHYALTYESHDLPLVIARDKQTNQICMFVSAHVQGMDLVDLVDGAHETVYGERCLEKLTPLMDTIAAEHSVTMRFVGADMNTSPEILGRRHQILNEAGYKIHRTGQTTEVNPRQQKLIERELDYNYSKTDCPTRSWLDRLFGTQTRAPLLQARSRVLMEPQQRDGIPYQSDHFAVQTEFSIISI